MARPKKTTARLFYDEFYAMTLEQQAIALMILAEHHEYVKKHKNELVKGAGSTAGESEVRMD